MTEVNGFLILLKRASVGVQLPYILGYNKSFYDQHFFFLQRLKMMYCWWPFALYMGNFFFLASLKFMQKNSVFTLYLKSIYTRAYAVFSFSLVKHKKVILLKIVNISENFFIRIQNEKNRV